MARLQSIVTRARYTLNDPSGVRYPDSKLIALANEAQLAIAKELNLLNVKEIFSITSSAFEYTFTSTISEITRAVNVDGDEIDIYTHYDMDEEDPSWENEEGGSVKRIVIDLNSIGTFRVFPKPNTIVGAIALYATVLPATMTALTDDPEIDSIHDKAIKHYIISHCLHEDHDQLNSIIGAQDFIMYEEEKKESKKLRSQNNTRRNRTVRYGAVV